MEASLLQLPVSAPVLASHQSHSSSLHPNHQTVFSTDSYTTTSIELWTLGSRLGLYGSLCLSVEGSCLFGEGFCLLAFCWTLQVKLVALGCCFYFLLYFVFRVMKSPQCQMDQRNLARVFGPTVVGHGMSEPSPTTIMRDTNSQPKVWFLISKMWRY